MLTRSEIGIGMLVRVDSTPIKDTDPGMTQASCIKGQIEMIHPTLDFVVVKGKWISNNRYLAQHSQFVAFADLMNYMDCIRCQSNFRDERGMLLASGLWLCMPYVDKTCNEHYPAT